MRNAGLEEAQTEIKIAGRNINNLRYADDTTSNAEIEEELKSLLLGRKVITNLDSILKSRYYFANKGPSGQGWFFQWSCMDVRVGL